MKKEQRFIKTNVTIRAVENEPEKRVIEGLIPYNKKSVNMGWDNNPFYEVIEPTAFNKTLGDRAKVVALFAHDRTKVLGNTKAGTLELENTDEGLICRCTLGNSSFSNDAWDMISRGDCNQMSFGFWPYIVRTEGNTDYLESVKLDEVSFCVLDPAYEDTTSKAEKRSIEEIKRAFENLPEEEKEEFKNTILNEGAENAPEEDNAMALTDEDIEKIASVVVEKLNAQKAAETPKEEESNPAGEPEGIPTDTNSTTDDGTSNAGETGTETTPDDVVESEEEKKKLLEEVDDLLKKEE